MGNSCYNYSNSCHYIDVKSWRETYQAGVEFYDWSTDGCSSAPDKFFGVNLYSCCVEHDFYYRNEVSVSRFTADNLLRKCIARKVKEKRGFKGWILAAVYFVGVRIGGGAAYRKKHGFVDKWISEEED